MTFDPEKHHRRSIRLKGYDYAQAGAYFVTICAYQRTCLFGQVENGVVVSSPYGRLAEQFWKALPRDFPRVVLDVFVVMPNHLHGIIILTGRRTAGAKHSPGNPKGDPSLYPRMLRPYDRHTVLSLDRWQQSCKISNRFQPGKSIGHVQPPVCQCGKETIMNISSGMKMNSPAFGNTSSTILCNGRLIVKTPWWARYMHCPTLHPV